MLGLGLAVSGLGAKGFGCFKFPKSYSVLSLSPPQTPKWQARFLAERNARRMNRLVDAPRGSQKKEQAPG